MKNIIRTRIYESPCGSLLLGSYGDMLCLCDWLAEKHHGSVRRRLERLLRAGFVEEVSPVTEEAARQLDEYFAGRRRAFDLPLLFAGTEFQKAVWGELLKIPFGFRPLPPCGRQRPFPDRLRRGNRGQAPVARVGGGAPSGAFRALGLWRGDYRGCGEPRLQHSRGDRCTDSRRSQGRSGYLQEFLII